MNTTNSTHTQDVMQVCHNGHVITDLLHTYPERGASYCTQCGAATLERCRTCGQEIQGAVHIPGLMPIGRQQPPQFCSKCGASFPWSEPRVKVSAASGATAAGAETPEEQAARSAAALTSLERLLRRLPRVIRQLRVRQGDRPPFRVIDERDLEDLLRSLLPLQFDDVRPECRTASYAPGTSTDFLVESQAVFLTVKRMRSTTDEKKISVELQEDVDYYEDERSGGTLVCFIYDPEGLLHEPRQLELMWSKPQDKLDVRCVIGS